MYGQKIVYLEMKTLYKMFPIINSFMILVLVFKKQYWAFCILMVSNAKFEKFPQPCCKKPAKFLSNFCKGVAKF